ncbi:MAG: alpha-glucuronidase [Prevotella sp.]|nr:alpha-glucuronidase [Prevotella sp.]
MKKKPHTLKRIIILSLFWSLLTVNAAMAEDGSRLWLRYDTLRTAQVKGPEGMAHHVLTLFYPGRQATLRLDAAMSADDGYTISGTRDALVVSARSQAGLLYGAFAALRGETGASSPCFPLRILNHWDNLDGSIERGYAGQSIFWMADGSEPDMQRLQQYALACASVGINGTVLNNVNASPKMLTRPYLNKVKAMADVLRPYGIRVYLSVNFGSPKALGELPTADPLNKRVQRWWQRKADEIYRLVPDFGGFLVKANSEGQPGPFDYGRTHADGANMLADALRPHGGIVMWRSFVYGAKHKGEDRVMQAVSEFKPCDGQFRENVILQSKNGPLDFQPREPYAPIFDQMEHTPQMAELQITQEYLGQSTHLVFLAPMWKEFFSFVTPKKLVGIAGVANVGDDANWCGHHFAQANWYAFGRLAWNPSLSSKQIAEEWLSQTFDTPQRGNGALSVDVSQQLLSLMLRSREACIDYMMPLGLHHIFKFDHHYGPEPDGFKADYPLEWCPVYYHQADSLGVGFDRTQATGSGATAQYSEPYQSKYEKLSTCPERYLLWFHHVPWTYRTLSGRTLWQEMQYRYQRGVSEVEDFVRIWDACKDDVDAERWQAVAGKLQTQQRDAREWRDVCLHYFSQFAEGK